MAIKPLDQVEQLSFSLAIHLAHTAVFAQLLHNFHWNYVGLGFNYMHEFLDQDYTELNGQIDKLAEYIITLGFQPPSSLSDYVKLSQGIKEMPPTSDRTIILKVSLGAHNFMGQVSKQVFKIANEIEANDISDYMGQLQDFHYKKAWFYRAELGQSIATLVT